MPGLQLREIGVLGTHTAVFTKVVLGAAWAFLAHLPGCSKFVVSWQGLQDEERKTELGARCLLALTLEEGALWFFS